MSARIKTSWLLIGLIRPGLLEHLVHCFRSSMKADRVEITKLRMHQIRSKRVQCLHIK